MKLLPRRAVLTLSVITVATAALVSGTILVPSADAQPASSFSQLTNIRVGRHATYDRVVLDFHGPAPAAIRHAWVGRLTADPSGKPVPLAGHRFLAVHLRNAAAVDVSGRPTYTGPRTFRTPALRNVQAVAVTGDFEHVLSIGIGVRHTASVHVFTLSRPTRVVVDIGH